MFLIVVAGVVISVVAAYFALFLKKAAPTDPPIFQVGLPLVGTFKKFAGSPVGTVREAFDKLGPVFTMNMFTEKLTFVIGPDAQAAFFRGDDDELDQAPPYSFMKPVFGPNIVYDAPLPVRRQQLAFLRTALSGPVLSTYVDKIIDETQDYFSQWGESGEIDLLETLSELTILTASRCLMGDDVRSRMFKEISQLYHDLDGGLTALSIFFPNAPIPAHFTRNRARREMVKLFKSIIDERRAKGEVRNDVLQRFMDAEYKDGKQCTVEEVTGLMIALLFAGQHTSSITSTWTTRFLMEHPDLMERARAEQDEVLKDLEGPITRKHVDKMDMMHNCVHEVLRMYPPLLFLMRKVLVPQTVGDKVIPAGHTIVASPAVSMMLPEAFSNPERYDPDRFAPGREEQKAHPFAFIGFGGGRHGCMGANFGLLQVKTIVSTLIRDFELTPVTPFPKPDYTAMVVGPKGPVTVRFQRRQKK